MRRRFLSAVCIPALALSLLACGTVPATGQTQEAVTALTTEDPSPAQAETPEAAESEPDETQAEVTQPEQAVSEPAGSEEEEMTEQGSGAGSEQTAAVERYAIMKRVLPESEALSFTRSLGAGWNLGNTLDAYQDGSLAKDLSDELKTETCWQPVATNKEMFVAIREAGFSSVRIPVSWHNHIMDENCTISPVWLDRVNQIVDWALEADLKVILNIHHDNHPEAKGFYPDQAHRAQSVKYIGAVWQQLAERFRDYDDRLIFESMNEPRLVGTESEWWFDVNEPEAAVRESITVINELNQLFVDTVRCVEGSHRTCYLMCPGYCASPDGALCEAYVLPTDAEDIRDHLIVSVHAYTPYHFALEDNGTGEFDPFVSEDTQEIKTFQYKLYEKYVSKGIPVVIGEFGARDRDGNVEARAAFAGYYAANAAANGMPVLWWDNGAFSGSGEVFGLLDRSTGEWRYPEIRDAIVRHAIGGDP